MPLLQNKVELVIRFVEVANNNNTDNNIVVITDIRRYQTNYTYKNHIDKMLKQAKIILWATKC